MAKSQEQHQSGKNNNNLSATTSEKRWYAVSAEQALQDLSADPKGLSAAEAATRKQKYGPNTLPRRKKVTLPEIIIHQFTSPLIYVLLAAAVVSFILQEFTDGFFILMVTIVNALIGTTQEWKAETNASALQDMMKVQARVKRDGQDSKIDAEELVPGDIVLLESGNKVPADIRLFQSHNLSVEEALLTGESLPVSKNIEILPDGERPVAERLNMVHAGTTITSGRARGVVVNTATKTEIGKIATSLTEMESTKPPLVKRMEKFAQRISIMILAASIFLGIIGYFGGISLKDIFYVVVAAAVAAIPEGLPIAMTVALSIGTQRMAKRNVIVRKLTAVEGLGSCTYIATDKTGTLTVDQQTVKVLALANGEDFTVTGEGYKGEGSITDANNAGILPMEKPQLAELIKAVTVCNESSLFLKDGAWVHQGDAVDVALMALSYKAGTSPEEIYKYAEKVAEIPFESERKFAAVYYKEPDGRLKIAVKGALEVLMAKTEKGTATLLEEKALSLASKGYRVIAVAGNEITEINTNELPPLQILGLVALIDPLRPEAREAIKECHGAGVSVAMITGDHPSTALSIAMELGIASDKRQLISGAELGETANATDPEFLDKVKEKRVFARVSPAQKQKIVAALKHLGHYVAVTGDGVNDAPALKTANIGVAMGYGTDVAKDAASIIITDNNFASIAAGIEEGRFTYGNLRKIIFLLIPTGASVLLTIALSLLLGLPLPFLAVQLLWINLVTNGIQDVALAFEKGEKGVMKLPPRKPTEGVFDKQMIQQSLLTALAITVVTFGLWYHLLNNLGYAEFEARNIVLLLMVLLQNFHAFNARSEIRSVFKIPLKDNIFLMWGIVAAQTVHIISMHLPFMQKLLRIESVSLEEWIKLLPTAAIVIVVIEIFKWYKRRVEVVSRKS